VIERGPGVLGGAPDHPGVREQVEHARAVEGGRAHPAPQPAQIEEGPGLLSGFRTGREGERALADRDHVGHRAGDAPAAQAAAPNRRVGTRTTTPAAPTARATRAAASRARASNPAA
jgi:hypothetical protein